MRGFINPSVDRAAHVFDKRTPQVAFDFSDGSEMNITELAEKLGLTNAAMTLHIKKLTQCGILKVRLAVINRNAQKLCSLADNKILIEICGDTLSDKHEDKELNVGQFTEIMVNPTCGLADSKDLIGSLDNPQCFYYPERFGANVLWFCDGFVTYTFPNTLRNSQKLKEVQFSFELSGEAPGAVEHYPSQIAFEINDTDVGTITCEGEYFDRKGRFTPPWWFANFGQYGKFRVLTVSSEGTFMDGTKIGDPTLEELGIEQNSKIELKFKCKSTEQYPGGISLFGKNFGDFAQGIKCRLLYTENA